MRHSLKFIFSFFFACEYLFPFVEKAVFFHWTPFTSLSKFSWLYLCGFLSEFSILFHWSFVSPSQWTPQHSISVGCSADRTNSGDKRPGVAQTYQILVVLSCVGFWGLVSSLAKLGWYSFSIYRRGVCFENFYTMYSHMTSSCKHFLIPSLIQSVFSTDWGCSIVICGGGTDKGHQTDALLKEAFIMQWWSVSPGVRKTWVQILILPLLVFELGKVL